MVTVKVRVRDNVAAQTVEDTAFCKCGLLFASPNGWAMYRALHTDRAGFAEKLDLVM